MEVKIAVQDTPREVVLESTQTPEQVVSAVNAAIAKGGLLTLADEKGRQVIVPAAKIAYVEIGVNEHRRVGFGTD